MFCRVFCCIGAWGFTASALSRPEAVTSVVFILAFRTSHLLLCLLGHFLWIFDELMSFNECVRVCVCGSLPHISLYRVNSLCMLFGALASLHVYVL